MSVILFSKSSWQPRKDIFSTIAVFKGKDLLICYFNPFTTNGHLQILLSYQTLPIVMLRIFQDNSAIVGCPQGFYCRIIQNRARQAPSLGEKFSVEQILTQGQYPWAIMYPQKLETTDSARGRGQNSAAQPKGRPSITIQTFPHQILPFTLTCLIQKFCRQTIFRKKKRIKSCSWHAGFNICFLGHCVFKTQFEVFFFIFSVVVLYFHLYTRHRNVLTHQQL